MSTENQIAIGVQTLQGNYKDQLLYSNFSFHFLSGYLYGLVGDNGTGKSTLLKQIAGLLPVKAQQVFYFQKDISILDAKTRAEARFYIHAASFTNRQIKVEACLALALNDTQHFFGILSEANKILIDESLNYFSIEKLKHKLLSEISDGEFQKVMLSMAYVSQCQIILLDEPTAYLDFKAKKETFQLLKQLCEDKQKCIVVATHDIYQLMETTQHLLSIKDNAIERITVENLKSSLSQI